MASPSRINMSRIPVRSTKANTPSRAATRVAISVAMHGIVHVASRFAITTVVVAATFWPQSASYAQSPEHITLSGTNVAVYNLVGRLSVKGGGSSIIATVTRRGRDAEKLEVGTIIVDGRTALRVGYPAARVTIPDVRGQQTRTEISVRDDGSFGNRYDAGSNNKQARRRGFKFAEGRRVQISDERGGLEAAADIELQVPSGVSLRLHLAVGEVDIRNVGGDIAVDVSSATASFTDVQGTLSLDSGSGGVALTNVTGLLSLDTGSGDVVARNVTSPGLIVDSGSGTVTVEGCACRKVSIETGSGDLNVSGMTTDSLALDTGSGNVAMRLGNNPRLITIDTGSGNVTLTVPANFGATLDIDTGSGGVTSDFPIQLTSKSRDQLRGRIGNGIGRVIVDTGSGSVRILKAN